MSWTLSGGDSADFYLINFTTNAPQTPYGGLLNITTDSVTLTAFMAGYEYNITVRGVNCGSQEGRESEPLTIRPQGMSSRYESNVILLCTRIKQQYPSQCSVVLKFLTLILLVRLHAAMVLYNLHDLSSSSHSYMHHTLVNDCLLSKQCPPLLLALTQFPV